MACLAPTINYKIPCVHTKHLFDAPLCEDQSLHKRIFNVIFHILFVVGIPLAIYQLYTFCSSKIAARQNTPVKALQALGISPSTSLKSLEEEKKKAIITQLPQWFVSNFAEECRNDLERTYESWFIDISEHPDESIDDVLGTLTEKISKLLANPWKRERFALPALTLPKDNPLLCDVVSKLLHDAWAEVLLNCNNPILGALGSDQYINGYITVDSRTILIEELRKHADKMSEKDRQNWINGIETAKVHNRLSVWAGGPKSTISVNPPK